MRCIAVVIGLCGLMGSMGAAAAAPARVAEPEGYQEGGETDGPVPATLRGAVVVRARAAERLLRQGAVAFDVSSAPRKPESLAPGAPWLPVPHRALPDAIWVPGAGAAVPTPPVDAVFRNRLEQATRGNLDAPLVIYCHERCWLSWNAAKRALDYGYRRVYWFADGIEGWTAARLPTAIVAPAEPPAGAGTDDAAPTAAAAAGSSTAPGAGSAPRIAVLDLELTGDLGGPDFAEQHAARLVLESNRLRADLSQSGRYRVVDLAPAAAAIADLKTHQLYLHDCNGCDLDVGRRLGADLVMVAWVDRVSGLILSLTYEIHDVATARIVARKSFDFRGDTDIAWNHAIDYAIRDLKASDAR